MEYELKVKFTDSVNDLDGLKNVITVIGWLYQKKENGKVVKQIQGSTSMPKPNSDNFVPLDDCSLEMLTSWVEPLIDKERLQNILNK
jgi:hypothetical protein